MNDQENSKQLRIREYNDSFRRHLNITSGSVINLSMGISALEPEHLFEILKRVVMFEDFTNENDPYGEHDFGAFDHNGEKIYWKIDYYDPDLKYGSEDPSDPGQTARVLTIMLANEY